MGIFIRKSSSSQFSLEYLFKEIYDHLPSTIKAQWLEAPYPSQGIWNRVKLIFWAHRNRKQVNHITGDIHFINLLLPKKKTILTIHDCEFVLRTSGLKRWILNLFWIRIPIWRSQIVTTISRDAKNDIIRLSGCREDKVVVIPNFVSEEFKPGDERVNAEPWRILQVGTKANKNLKRVIQACEGQPWELHIVGPLTNTQLDLLKTCEVKFQNYVSISREALNRLYQTCDALVFASLKEGFGLPILEAQQCRLPVITSNVSSMPEVAGEGALLVDPYSVVDIQEGIKKIFHDPLIKSKTVSQGIINVQRFSLEKTVQRYVRLYQSLIA